MKPFMSRFGRGLMLSVGVSWALALAAARPASSADRPSAPYLLPESTLAYVRIADTRELAERFQDTQMGRLVKDEKIKPLLDSLYGSARDAFSQVQEEIGVSLDSILSIPQGEVCLAIVGQTEGRPAFIGFLEVGEDHESISTLLARAELELINDGAMRSTESVGDVELTIFKPAEGPTLVYFIRQGVVVLATDVGLVKETLRVWDGEADGVRTLADNRQFTTIMRSSAGTKDERPQISWFADPIELARQLGRGNFGAQAGLAFLRPFGLDGINAIGGSMIFATEDFDSISHFHIMLKSPRAGIVDMVALADGDTTPEPWVPADTASYMTLHWDLDRTMSGAAKLYNGFRGEGAFEKLLQDRMGSRLGVNVREDLINQFGNRVTLATWIEPPVRINSQATMVGVKLNNAAHFDETLRKIVSQFPQNISRETLGSAAYYKINAGQQNTNPNIDPAMVRPPDPAFAIVGDYLIASDSSKFIKEAIRTKRDASKSLAEELDFKLIASNIGRHVGNRKLSMIAFQRPEESIRAIYELAVSEQTRGMLSRGAERNPALGVLNQALADHPLPPFAEIAKYLAPGGGLLIDDETGIHYTAFALRRD